MIGKVIAVGIATGLRNVAGVRMPSFELVDPLKTIQTFNLLDTSSHLDHAASEWEATLRAIVSLAEPRTTIKYLNMKFEQRDLYLPMMIEVGGGGQGESLLRCRGAVEEKVASRILGMPMACRQGGITLYRPQLAKLRGVLATTTQYAFVIRASAGGEEE